MVVIQTDEFEILGNDNIRLMNNKAWRLNVSICQYSCIDMKVLNLNDSMYQYMRRNTKLCRLEVSTYQYMFKKYNMGSEYHYLPV